MSNESSPKAIETVGQILWQNYVALIQDTGDGDDILLGLTYDEAVSVVEVLFQQSLITPYDEKSPEGQIAYTHIASLHHSTFDEA